MAVKFYLNQIDNQHEIFCDTNSTYTEIAGSFNIGTIELEWNTNKHAIFPYTKLFIVDSETNNKWCFVVSQDNVSVVNKNGTIKYLHTLTVTQNTHKLNNHILRNTSFVQPYDYEKHFQKNIMFYNEATWTAEGGGHLVTYDYHSNFFYNDDEILKTQYSIDFADSRRKLKSGYFTVNERAAWYLEQEFSGQGGFYQQVQKNPAELGVNNTLNTLYIRLVNCDDSTDKIYAGTLINADGRNDFGKKIYLNQEQLNWMNGKKFFVQYEYATTIDLSNTLDLLNKSDVKFPQVFGLITCDFYFESYYYSLWDVLRTIQLQEIQDYNYHHKDYLYILPNRTETEEGRLLDSIIAPEFNFTGVDVYTAVAQVLSYIDAFPTIDENNVLHFEYLNDLSKDKINNLKENDTKISLNEQNFSNKLVANYQNGRTKNAIYCPSEHNFKYLGSNNFGVVDRNDYWFMLDSKIDYIDQLNLYVNKYQQTISGLPYGISSTTATFEDFPIALEKLDISTSIFDREIYEQLPEAVAQTNFPNKNNTLYYSKGDNKIYAGKIGNIVGAGESEVLYYAMGYAFARYLGTPYQNTPIFIEGTDTNTLRQTVRFNCLYHAIFDGRVSQESTINKVDGETTVAQENSGVDLNRMGNNLQGLIAKLGTEQKTVNLPITEFKDKYKVGTIWEDEEGGKWFINQIKTTFTTSESKVIVDATFTKNFNMLSQFTKINQEKRFYDISTKLTETGYENINEFIYFSNRDLSNLEGLAEEISLTYQVVLTMLCDDNRYLKLDFATLTTQNNENSSSAIDRYIPLHTYGNGNQICFEVGYDSPINAGNHIIENNGSFINETSLYTDKSGFADITSLSVYDSLSANQFDRNFPYVSNSYTDEMYLGLLIEQFYYYKKPTEIFHLNYSINFMPYFTKTTDSLGTPIYTYDEIFFGDKFINENNILSNVEYTRDIYIYVATEKFSMLDNKVRTTDTNLGQVSLSISNLEDVNDWKTYGLIIPILNNDEVNVKNYAGWCLADREGNILISCNNSENSIQEAELRYFTSRYRKE